MEKHSVMPEIAEDIANFPLDQLQHWIVILEHGARQGGSASLRKRRLEKLIWLEQQRASLHGIPAPRRRRF